MVLQDADSVFDTDGFRLIMDWVEQESGVAYGDSEVATKAHRVLADHARAMSFLVAEGVTPANEGRGYICRRIIRRAVQHGQRIGLRDVYRLGGKVVEQMGDAYPELREHAAEIERVVKAEEERFGETLQRGMKVFDELAGKESISGEDAFTLAATYGFPIELTQELAEERGQPVDVDRFHELMLEHREISRAGGEKTELQRAADFAREAGFRAEFVGFEKVEALTQVGALEPAGDGLFLAKLRETPFYAAGGGQVTDQGWIEKDDGSRAELREAYRFERRPGAPLRRRRLRRGRPREGGRLLVGSLPDDGEPHRDAPPSEGVAGGARRARPPGRLGGPPRQAALRLHPSAAAHAGGARRGRAARQRTRSPPPSRCGPSRCRSPRRGSSAR